MTIVQGFTIHSPRESVARDAVGFTVKTDCGEQAGSIARTTLLEMSPGIEGSLLQLFEINRTRILEMAFEKWSRNPENEIVLGAPDI